MDNNVDIITKKLLKNVPPDSPHLKPEQFDEIGIPGFVVHQLKAELENRFSESFQLPDNTWTDLDSDPVQDAWETFIEKAREHCFLPESEIEAVFRNVSEDLLKALIQPRKTIPSLLFGNDEKLDAATLEKRTDRVHVNRHLALAPLKYMHRKELQTLDIEKCKQVITTVDDRLAGSYTAVEWAELLEPLYLLIGDSVDSDLFRIFFEDKGCYKEARHFENLDGAVSRSRLKEVITSVDHQAEPEFDSEVDAEVNSELESDHEPKHTSDLEPEHGSVKKPEHGSENEPKPEPEPESFQSTLFPEAESGLAAQYMKHTDDWPSSEEESTEEESTDGEPAERLNKSIWGEPRDASKGVEEEGTPIGTDRTDDRGLSLDSRSPEAGKKAPSETHSDGRRADEDAVSADEKPAVEKPVDEKPADEKPVAEKPADEKPAVKHLKLDENQSLKEVDTRREGERNQPGSPAPDRGAEKGTGAGGQSGADSFSDAAERGDEAENREDEAFELARHYEKDEEGESTLYSRFMFDKEEAGEEEEEPEDSQMSFNAMFRTIEEMGKEGNDESEPAAKREEWHVPNEALRREDASSSANGGNQEGSKSPNDDTMPEREQDTGEGRSPEVVSKTDVRGTDEPDYREQLQTWIGDESSRIVEGIFHGSETAYEQAIGRLAKIDSWSEAASYIEKEIFNRNNVDMYEEVAVDFTDLLHTFFNEFKTEKSKS